MSGHRTTGQLAKMSRGPAFDLNQEQLRKMRDALSSRATRELRRQRKRRAEKATRRVHEITMPRFSWDK